MSELPRIVRRQDLARFERPSYFERRGPGLERGTRRRLTPNGLSAEERQALVLSVLGLCRKAATRTLRLCGLPIKKPGKRCGDSFSMSRQVGDELYATALYGACRASVYFDPDRGVKFVTYAHHQIVSAIRDAMRSDRPLGFRESGKTPPKMHPLARRPTGSNILGDLASLALPDTDLGDNLEDVPADEGERWAEPDWQWLLSGLTAREAEAVQLYYREGLGQAEAGEVMGVSDSRVEQLLRKARERLRPMIERGQLGRAA